jgi:hypothetical protein
LFVLGCFVHFGCLHQTTKRAVQKYFLAPCLQTHHFPLPPTKHTCQTKQLLETVAARPGESAGLAAVRVWEREQLAMLRDPARLLNVSKVAGGFSSTLAQRGGAEMAGFSSCCLLCSPFLRRSSFFDA